MSYYSKCQLSRSAILILIAQMIGSTLWLRHFPMGPVEYIWRVGTYGRIKL
ncbi:DUF418 domain-containing protein [Paenibacillus sp. FA6]|uniref:DUF418 domain-containing protein n=1 Tax=Paenibacillus sp. FA6 TaxID=3413029 RepID=UPI003F65B161